VRRAFSLPIVILLVLIVATPVVAFMFLSKKTDDNVKGAETFKADTNNELTLQVNSANGTWDLLEYLCTAKDSCDKTLESGKRWQTLSGGPTQDHEVIVSSSDDLKGYDFLKIYIRPGWGSANRKFAIQDKENITPAQYANITDGTDNYDVVMVPIKGLDNYIGQPISFSDQ
jgi:hypothetical protein